LVGMARCAVPARVVAGGMKYSSDTANRKNCAAARSAMSLPGRDVRPNVPDHFGGIRVRTAGSGSAQRQRKSGRVIPRSRVAKNKSGTLRRASLPVIGWRVDTNMPKRDCQSLLPGGTLSPTSLIFSAAAMFCRPGRTRRKAAARLSPVRLFFIRTSRGKQMGR